MKLAIYLFKTGFTDYETLIRDSYKEGERRLEKLGKLRELPFQCEAYALRNRQTTPKWLSLLTDYFDLGSNPIQNVTNSAILFLTVSDRVFAVSFGYGHSAIDRTKLEPRFGLKVALNSLSHRKIISMDTRRIDLVTKQSKIQYNNSVPIEDFGIDYSIDWIRYVSGRPDSREFASRISGSDPLSITCEVELSRLGDKCTELLTLYQSDAYKEIFPYLDSLLPLDSKDPLVDQLEEKLNGKIIERSTEKIAVAYPEIFSDDVAEFKIFKGNHSSSCEDVELASIYSFLDEIDSNGVLDNVKIVGLDSEGNAKTHAYRLRDCLVSEIAIGSNIYVLSFGQWFATSKDFVNDINKQLDQIEDITGELSLPDFVNNNEGDYNTTVASSKGWTCLDKKAFHYGGRHQKVEICDLLTPDFKLIAVKKMSSSATLSHLFAQGSVSAQLYRSVPEYRTTVEMHYVKAFKRHPEEVAEKPVFVYAIITDKNEALKDCMFFFSKVNLINHADAIKSYGYDVKIAKISM